MALPTLRFHAPTKQHYVWDAGQKKRVYFGTDPTTARTRYAHWLAGIGGPPALPAPSEMTVADALEAYRRFAAERYTDQRARSRIGLALRAVSDLYGRLPATSFKAKALRDVRQAMIGRRSRAYVNKLTQTIQTAWRWLAAEELVPAECAASVRMVPPLKAGDGGRERPPVLPPEPGAIEAVLPRLSVTVAAMLRVQLLTGARPGEVCRMRAGEVSQDPGQPVLLPGTGRTVAALRCGDTVVWVYAPGSHKTAWRGKAKVIVVGPKAQAILSVFLPGRKPQDLVFPPKPGSTRPYRSSSYATAVQRACSEAGCPPWTPNQLRHLAATEIAERTDIHTAAAVLGHAPGSGATGIYVEQAVKRAADAAARFG